MHTLDRKRLCETASPTSESEECFCEESGEVVEVSLLLSAGQMFALEEAAHDRGMTAAEMFRQVLHDFIAAPTSMNKAPVR